MHKRQLTSYLTNFAWKCIYFEEKKASYYKLISFFKRIVYILILNKAAYLVILYKNPYISLKFQDYYKKK